MKKGEILDGVVHKVPVDMRGALLVNRSMLEIWSDITPLARNEWICWIESAKKLDTRNRRLRIAKENLTEGKRRPCCWAGCPHR